MKMVFNDIGYNLSQVQSWEDIDLKHSITTLEVHLNEIRTS